MEGGNIGECQTEKVVGLCRGIYLHFGFLVVLGDQHVINMGGLSFEFYFYYLSFDANNFSLEHTAVVYYYTIAVREWGVVYLFGSSVAAYCRIFSLSRCADALPYSSIASLICSNLL